jgi:hypothetical protein
MQCYLRSYIMHYLQKNTPHILYMKRYANFIMCCMYVNCSGQPYIYDELHTYGEAFPLSLQQCQTPFSTESSIPRVQHQLSAVLQLH